MKEIMRRTNSRITISDDVIMNLPPSVAAVNTSLVALAGTGGYRWVIIKGGDALLSDTLVRNVIESGSKVLNMGEKDA